MPIVIPPGYAQTVLEWENEFAVSGRCATVLGFGADLGPDPTPLLEFAGDVALAVANHLVGQYHVLQRLTGVYVANETSSVRWEANLPGSRANDQNPASISVLTTYRTSRKGPRGRGRSYWPGMVADGDVNSEGNLSTARFNEVSTAIDNFFGEIEEITPQVILQRDEPDQVTPPISPPPVVLTRQTQARVATQRRRLRK